MLHASKTPDESGNYNHVTRVTYKFGISMSLVRHIQESVKGMIGANLQIEVKMLGFENE